MWAYSVPGTAQDTSHESSHWILATVLLGKIASIRAVIVSLQMGKLRHRAAKQLAQTPAQPGSMPSGHVTPGPAARLPSLCPWPGRSAASDAEQG